MSSLKNNLRLILVLAGFFGVFFLPPWMPLAAALVLSILFRAWEVIIMGVLIDFMWQGSVPYHIPIATTVAIVLVWALEPLRREFLNS